MDLDFLVKNPVKVEHTGNAVFLGETDADLSLNPFLWGGRIHENQN